MLPSVTQRSPATAALGEVEVATLGEVTPQTLGTAGLDPEPWLPINAGA